MNPPITKSISQCLLRNAVSNPDKGVSRNRLIGKLKYGGLFQIVPCVHNPPCAQPNKEKTLKFQREFPEIMERLEKI